MKTKIKNAIIGSAAIFSGLCNSLLGAGGGIILTGSLSGLFGDAFPDKRDIYVNSQAAMIPGCALSCAIYSHRGMLDTNRFAILAIPAMIGGIIGSLLLTRIRAGWIRLAFSVIVVWSGIRMILS